MSEAEPLRLEVGPPHLRDLAGGQTHPYLIHLEPGQFLQFVADQRGIDLRLRFLDPLGEVLRNVDTPNGKDGPERVLQVATVAGDYRIEVIADEGARPGRYQAVVEALRPATPVDVQRFEAEKIFQEGEVLRKASDWLAAKAKLEEALSRWRALGDQNAEALVLYRIGATLRGLEKPNDALAVYDAAVAACRATGDAYGEARTLNVIGAVFQDQERLDEARDKTIEALQIFQRIGSVFGQANALNNLGTIEMEAGRTAPAIDSLRQAAALFQQLGDSTNEGRVEANLGKLYLLQGRPEESRDALEASRLAAEKAQDSRQLATTLSHLGELDNRQGRLPEARTNLERALALQRQIGDEKGQAVTLVSLGTVLLKSGDLDGAWQVNEEALALFRKIRNVSGEGVVLLSFGRIRHARGEDQQAVAEQRQARALFERTGDRELVAATRFGAARSLARLGDLEGARGELEGSLELVEAIRAEEPGLTLRAAFFATKQDYWDLYVDILMRLHQSEPGRALDARALEVSERRRARSLLDALRETKTKVEQQADPQLASQIDEAESRLGLAETRRLNHLRAESEKSVLATDEVELRSALGSLDLLRTRMSQRSAGVRSLAPSQPIALRKIQKDLIDKQSLLLVYALGEERSYLWTVASGSIASYTLTSRSEIEAVARQLASVLPRASREAEATERRQARALTEMILAPAAERIAAFPRLLVVADGALQLIPFAALPIPRPTAGEESHRMVEQHEVVSLPSISVLAELQAGVRKRKPLDKIKVAVVADPVFQPDDPRVRSGDRPRALTPLPADLTRSVRDLDLDGLKRLPYTRQEGEAILGLTGYLSPLGAFDFNASRELFTQGQLNDFDVIHVATHSLLDNQHPDLSGIVLSLVDSSGARKEGFLRLHEIYGLDLKAGLVVLSACETGSGRAVRGEGLLGMTRGFLSAGVPQLVVSLWKVEDDSTAELMRRFYEQLFDEGLPTGQALRRAQVSMLQDPRWSAPRHWAGFVFVGDYRRSPKSGGGLEEDAGGVTLSRKASSDLPPPKVPRDRPAPPAGGGH